MCILPGEQQLYVTTAASQYCVMYDREAKKVPELQKALCWMLLAAPLQMGAELLQQALLYPLPTPAMTMTFEVACMADIRGRRP